MNKYIKMAFASACCVLFAQCSDFLETSSPSNTDDEFVTSSPAETLKTLSRAYDFIVNRVMGHTIGTTITVRISNISPRIILPIISMKAGSRTDSL